MTTRLTYLQARLLLLVLGVAVAVSQALLAWERGAAPTEVLAPILYIPVFTGAIFFYLPGGLVAAGISSVIYGTLLADVTARAGLGQFLVLLATRVSFYLLFGVVVALGTRYIEARLHKLEVYDQIDDETGLYNSAFFLQHTDLEASRADRYQTFFSVATLDVRREVLADLPSRRQRRVIKELASRIEESIRHVDRAVHADDGSRDRFLIVLPQTGGEGARIFAERLEQASAEFLSERGCSVDGHLPVDTMTYPDAPERLRDLREEITRLEDRRRTVRGGS